MALSPCRCFTMVLSPCRCSIIVLSCCRCLLIAPSCCRCLLIAPSCCRCLLIALSCCRCLLIALSCCRCLLIALSCCRCLIIALSCCRCLIIALSCCRSRSHAGGAVEPPGDCGSHHSLQLPCGRLRLELGHCPGHRQHRPLVNAPLIFSLIACLLAAVVGNGCNAVMMIMTLLAAFCIVFFYLVSVN